MYQGFELWTQDGRLVRTVEKLHASLTNANSISADSQVLVLRDSNNLEFRSLASGELIGNTSGMVLLSIDDFDLDPQGKFVVVAAQLVTRVIELTKQFLV